MADILPDDRREMIFAALREIEDADRRFRKAPDGPARGAAAEALMWAALSGKPMLAHWAQRLRVDLSPFFRWYEAAWRMRERPSELEYLSAQSTNAIDAGFPDAWAALTLLRYAVGQAGEVEAQADGRGGGAGKGGAGAVKVGETKRRGRLPEEDAKAKRATLRAFISEHASMKYDYDALAFQVGISPDTARRWVGDDDRTYRERKAAGPPKPK